MIDPNVNGSFPRDARCSQFLFSVLFAFVFPAQAPSAPTAGIAADHPGGAGLQQNPAVIFTEDFESGDLKRWDETRGAVRISKTDPRGGGSCLESAMVRGENTGGDLIKWFLPGNDRIYARFYVKFSSDYQYAHHFVTLLANHRTNRWSAFGKAGMKPDGTYFSSGMEPWFAWGKNPPPGELNFYSYFLDMEPDRKMNKFWGNSFFPPGPGKGEAASSQRIIPALGTWQCWEFMVQANTPADQANGRQVMWLNGKKVGEFSGIRWRQDEALKINCFWLQHYGYDASDPTDKFTGARQTVWFDDVVVAREYIGPAR